MSKKNIMQEVQAKIDAIQEKKRQEVFEVELKMVALNTENEKLLDEKIKAMSNMNMDAYKEIEHKIDENRLALKMYSEKLEQVKKQEYITEQESDAVIDSLLDYEKILEKDFVADIKAPIIELRKILNDYFGAVRETEQTIRTWETQIHANYSTRGATFWTDKETGKTTDRSNKPVLVHSIPYDGCGTAISLNEYLNKAPFKNL